MGFPPRESDVEGMTAGDVICRTPRAVNTPHPAMQAESVISKNPVYGHQRHAGTIKPRLVNIVRVIRSWGPGATGKGQQVAKVIRQAAPKKGIVLYFFS